jgi:hypothetical protein
LLRGAGEVPGFRRVAAHSVLLCTVLVLMVVICSCQIPPAQGAPSSTSTTKTTSASSLVLPSLQGGIAIDKQQFVTSVPSYALLGVNYTLRVVVQSSVSIVVPVVIKIAVPVEAIFVHPQIIKMDVQPESSAIANFTILPFGAPHTGPFDVTAQLYVFFLNSNMSSPELVDQATAVVSSIGPNPFPYLDVVLVSAGAVTIVLVAVFYPDVFRRRDAGP